MREWRLLVAVLGFEALLLVGSTYCFLVGIRSGFVKRKMKRAGEPVEAFEAVKAGAFYCLSGLFGLYSAYLVPVPPTVTPTAYRG